MPLIIDIHDVGHGACSVLTLPDGRLVMIDCGSRSGPTWRPSDHYRGSRIDTLIITNLDADHVSDFANVMSTLHPKTVIMNPTISASRLRDMKIYIAPSSPMGAVEEHLRSYGPVRNFEPRPFPYSRHFPFIDWFPYYNQYALPFCDTNNLSLVSIFSYSGFKIVYGGDMEARGWNALASSLTSDFYNNINMCNVFVASHHGRLNGYSERIMNAALPQIVVFSDNSVVHETQNTNQIYRQHARGAVVRRYRGAFGSTSETRRVLTTRKDGSIRIVVEADAYTIDRNVTLPRDPSNLEMILSGLS